MANESIAKALEPLKAQYEEFSAREKIIIWIAVGIALLLGLYTIISSIAPAFENQRKLLVQLEKDVETLPALIGRWSTLSKTKKSIESTFGTSNSGIGTKSYLEEIIKTKIGITDLKNIKSLPPRSFGQDGKFENTLYEVNFFTDEIKQVVSFLEAVTQGEKPLILSKISIKKISTKLNVEIELSSISQKAA